MKAEELGHYWMTSKTAPDAWLDKTEGLIEGHGGTILSRGHGKMGQQEAYMLEFRFSGETFRIEWPVLPSSNQRAARVQAATLIYHDVKGKIVAAKVHGTRAAFFQYLLLPDGRTAVEIADSQISTVFPNLSRPLLSSPDDSIDGEYEEL